MPRGLNRTGDFRNVSPITLPHTFGTPVTWAPNPAHFGNPVTDGDDPTQFGNDVTWATPNPAHFGNVIAPATPTQPTPTFSPVAGSYSGAQTVTITSSGADSIYYTTDGSTPTTGSTLYSTPVSVGSSLTLKALAVRAGYLNSAIGSAAYVITIVAPAFIIGSAPSSAGSQTVSTVAVDTTGANFLIAAIASFIVQGASPTVTDNFGNTWIPLTTYADGTSGYGRLFYCANATVGAAHVVTYDSAQGGNITSIAFAAFSGVALVSPFGTQNGAGAGAQTIQPGAVSAAAIGDLIISGSAKIEEFSTNASTIDSGFTLAASGNFSFASAAVAYLIAVDTNPVNPTWTRTQVGLPFIAEIATFSA